MSQKVSTNFSMCIYIINLKLRFSNSPDSVATAGFYVMLKFFFKKKNWYNFSYYICEVLVNCSEFCQFNFHTVNTYRMR